MSKRVQLVVLDDDPTGIQTVHGCYLLTQWDLPTLREAMADEHNFFYVLTNTRARAPADVEKTIAQIVANVQAVNDEFSHELVFMSRSDSTLRSHFPLEIDTIVDGLQLAGANAIDGFFLVPAFFEGGRVTVDDTHYILDGDRRTLASESEFARDSVFGYGTSHLPSYIEEKTGGRISADSVQSIPLEMLRAPCSAGLESFLAGLSDGRWVVVNAETYEDLDRFSAALLPVIARGRKFAFQCAASIVKSLSGIAARPLLRDELANTAGPGLFIVGSHVAKTTAQLNLLLTADSVEGIEVDVCDFLDDPDAMLERVVGCLHDALSAGKSPIVYTSRSEVQFDSPAARLQAGQKLSLFLASLVTHLELPISYVVAKGGITSHDVLVAGLGVKMARVMGQILPGVPVVRVRIGRGQDEIPCVIFPGNVGTDESLCEALRILSLPGSQSG